MANDRPDEIDVDDVPDGTDTATFADTLVARGRAVVDRVPAVADSAREALADAQDHVNQLSDMGVVAALGFALGVSSGLLLAGAPRVILALSAVPVALTLRSAMTRGVRPARLVN
jgi:NaMN:DMB phosphoribosyltransferase